MCLKKLDINLIKKDFPIFNKKIYGNNLIYLDNASTSQKPKCVIDAIVDFYSNYCSNINRSLHSLSYMATDYYNKARKAIQLFIGCKYEEEIIFTSGTTASLNLIAYSYGMSNVRKGDEIVLTEVEHHSNILPWQMLCNEKKSHLKIIPVSENGSLSVSEFERVISKKTKIISLSHISNVLGVVNPIKEISKIAKRAGAILVVDGSQAANHMNLDIENLGCDFYCFSGHKIYGPTGIGVLYGKKKILNNMPPFFLGGDMIKNVSFKKSIYEDIPKKFEAGTLNIAGIIGLLAAINYIKSIGILNISKHEKKLVNYALWRLEKIPKIKIFGTSDNRVSIISFAMKNIHTHDISSILDRKGIAIRGGHLCAQPLMDKFNIAGLLRISFGVYNKKSDIDVLINALKNVMEIF